MRRYHSCTGNNPAVIGSQNKPESIHLVHAKYLIIAGAILALHRVQAAETDACQTSLPPLSTDTLLSATPGTSDDAIEFQVGELDAQLGSDPRATMTGGVLLRQGNKLAGADTAR